MLTLCYRSPSRARQGRCNRPLRVTAFRAAECPCAPICTDIGSMPVRTRAAHAWAFGAWIHLAPAVVGHREGHRFRRLRIRLLALRHRSRAVGTAVPKRLRGLPVGLDVCRRQPWDDERVPHVGALPPHLRTRHRLQPDSEPPCVRLVMMRHGVARLLEGHQLIWSAQLWGRAAQPVVADARPGPCGWVQVVGAWILRAARVRSSRTAAAAATRAAAAGPGRRRPGPAWWWFRRCGRGFCVPSGPGPAGQRWWQRLRRQSARSG